MEDLQSIQNIFNTLNEHQQLKLTFAHRRGLTKYVVLPKNTFIGVHCDGIPNLIIQSTYNDWSIGEIIQSNNSIISSGTSPIFSNST